MSTNSILGDASDWLAALPKPDVVGDTLWKEKIVGIETWLYDHAYMNLGNIKLSPLQLEALEAMDDIDPDTNQKTEFVLEWG